MLKPSYILATALLLLFAVQSVFADLVLMKNGDKLSGKVVSTDEDTVVLDTTYAGEIKLDTKHVEKISFGSPAEVAIANRENTVPAKTVAEKPAKAETVKADPAKSPIKPIKRLFGEGPAYGIMDGWEGNANIGFNYAEGNTSISSLTTGIRAVKTGHKDTLTTYMRSQWISNRKNNPANRVTSNAVWGGARYDRNFNERMFSYGSYDFERDRPKLLNFRSVIGGGVGHHTIKNENTDLDLMLGGAWNRAWQIGENTDTPEAAAGLALKHKFNGKLKIQKAFWFYQDVGNSKKYRFIWDTTVSFDVTRRIGWYVTFGDRYNNVPLNVVEKNDFIFTTGLKWNFGKKR